MTKQIKSISTIYNGVSFRSKLEAKWAEFFDSIGMNWISEVEGYRFSDGTKYLPDFWLQDCRTYFEVKVPLNEKDMTKMRNLAEAVAKKGIMVAIGGSLIPDALGLIYPIPYKWGNEWEMEDSQGIICDRDYVDIAICGRCKKPYIIWLHQDWSCRNCDYGGGNNTFKELILHGKENYKKFNF